MRVAAFQAPLASSSSIDAALSLIRQQVDCCESERVDILCCPEGILGGLADYVPRPEESPSTWRAANSRRPGAAASDRVTTIVGFTEPIAAPLQLRGGRSQGSNSRRLPQTAPGDPPVGLMPAIRRRFRDR
jgi:hypothetical protein